MTTIYKILSWTFYQLGCVACAIMELFDDSETWVGIWYPVYNNLMIWSGEIQDYAGFDPHKVENTNGWPWFKADPEDKEE